MKKLNLLFIIFLGAIFGFNEYLYGQCNVLIPSNVITGNANLGGSGGKVRLLCANDSVTGSGGGGNTYFMGSGSYVNSAGGGGHIIYVKNNATLNISGGGGSITVYYEPNAIINNTLAGGGSNTFTMCTNITFDYSNFIQSPCDNCNNDVSITPQNNTSQTGGSVSFTVTTSDLNPSFIWQSDFGQGFQTLNNFGNYSGVNTSNLTINNLQLANHLQQIRAISSSGNCIDTSNVATINLTDTCINYITVTDTLIINTTLSLMSPPNNVNTIKVYPNPSNTHLTIDYGDYILMNGYTLQIVNTPGQTMYSTQINQQSSYIDLTTWSGNGIYFVKIIDPQSNIVENRKIVIQ